MGKMSREKGRAGELQARDLLHVAFPDVARRAAGEEAQERQGVDLKNTPGFVFQVQLAKKPTIEAKILEAEAATRPGEIPVALTRRSAVRKKGGGRSSGKWYATLPALFFVELLTSRKRTSDALFEAGEKLVAQEEELETLRKERDELGAELAKAVSLLERVDVVETPFDEPRFVRKTEPRA